MGVQNQKWQWQGYVRNRFFLRLHSLCTRALAHPHRVSGWIGKARAGWGLCWDLCIRVPLPLSPFTVSSHRDGGPSPVTVPFVQSRGFFPLRIPRPAANDDGFIFTAGKHQTTRCRPLLGAKCQRASGRTGTGKEYTEASRMLLPSSWMGSWPFMAGCNGVTWLCHRNHASNLLSNHHHSVCRYQITHTKNKPPGSPPASSLEETNPKPWTDAPAKKSDALALPHVAC
jgi:hypothetical protein